MESDFLVIRKKEKKKCPVPLYNENKLFQQQNKVKQVSSVKPDIRIQNIRIAFTILLFGQATHLE